MSDFERAFVSPPPSRRSEVSVEWFVIRSATRQEPRAEKGLKEAKFTVYLPLATCFTRTNGFRKKVKRPLFPGYLFVRVEPDRVLKEIEDIDGVHAAIRFGRERAPATLADPIIEAIRQAEAAGAFDKTNPTRTDPRPGDKITIVQGIFIGRVAEWVERRPDDRIRVLMNMLGRKIEHVLKPAEVGGLIEREDEAA